jgi:DNA polymerase I
MTYLTEEEFNKHLLNMQQSKVLTVDTEGTLNHPYSTTWGISTSANSVSEYFGFNHMIGDNLPQNWLYRLRDVIENHPCLVMHHAKHDLKALKSIGIDFQGFFYCSMLMQHMVDENVFSKELDWLLKYYNLGAKEMPEAAKAIIKGFGWPYIPVDLMRSYADNDANRTEALFYLLIDDFLDQGFGEIWEVEQKFLRLLIKIENNGVLVDQNLCERELERGLRIMDTLERGLGFNPGSPKQMGKFLLEDMGLPVVKRNKPTERNPQGNPSFDKEAMKVYDELLSRTNDPRAKQILTYRGWAKTTSSNYKAYLNLLYPQDGRLRPNFKMHGTVTGRLSCEHPNLQQIPRTSENDWNGNLKKAFITERGRTGWEVDYSQLEFRLGAAYGRVQRLIDIFNDDGRDVFTEISKDIGMTRQDTKTLVYTLQYGGGIQRLVDVFGVSSLAAKAIRENYFNNYRGLQTISNVAQRRCEQQGFVSYWTKRRRHFTRPDKEGHKAFNAVVQGGGFEIVKRRMIALDEAGLNNDECRMDLQVHDSVRFDIEDGKEDIYLPEIKKVMEDVPDFGVRFKVDVKKWGEKG